MLETVITKPIYRILADLTREERVEVALPLAMKDWVRLQLQEARAQRRQFEQLYGMDFAAFKRDWQAGRIPDAHSYETERVYWEWEATITDEQRLQQISESLP
jgi:hypothetical protein